MWHTSTGDRTLMGPEAALIREAVERIAEYLDMEAGTSRCKWDYRIPAFDRLTWQQRTALLADVGEALLRDDVPPPDLTGLNESVVAAIFEAIRAEVEVEIDGEPDASPEFRFRWRDLRLAATEAAEVGIERTAAEALPPASCPDLDEWEPMIEALEGAILWDRDWDFEEDFLDAPPDKADRLRDFLSIERDYFTAIPPDPTGAEVESARQRIHRLTGRAS
jgi:hypothetical protein